MKVYYSPSLWFKSEGISGIPQKVNLEFKHNGLKRIYILVQRLQKYIPM